MKRSLLVFILNIAFASSFANTNPRVPVKFWDAGEAFLHSGESVKGKIFYEFDKELVLIFNRGRIITYSSNQIVYFRIFDQQANMERLFVSIPLKKEGFSTRHYFFEKVMEGEIALLRKPRSYPDNFGLFMSSSFDPDTGAGAFYYYCFHEGRLSRIRNFKRDVVGIMGRHQDRIDTFIERNGLKLNRIKDQETILKYYNHLCSGQTMASRLP